MSLILDALKKLERERESPEQVVVVGSIPWQGVRRSRRLALLAALAGLLVMGAIGGWLLLGRPGGTRRDAASATPRPAAPPSTAAAAETTPLTQPTPATVPKRVVPPSGAERVQAPLPTAPPARPLATRGIPPGAGREATPPPGRSAQAAAEDRLDLQLMAISAQEGQPVAVISGRVVREGDRFDGVRVVRIGEAEVELEVRGRRRVLRF